MWRAGLLDEVAALTPAGFGVTASRAIGYAQAIAVLNGSLGVEEGIADTIRLTWRMVRRQRAWFGRDEDAVVLDGLTDGAAERVLAALAAATA